MLNRLIETARHDNLSLRIAGLRILESRALLGITGSSRYRLYLWTKGGQDGSGIDNNRIAVGFRFYSALEKNRYHENDIAPNQNRCEVQLARALCTGSESGHNGSERGNMNNRLQRSSLLLFC